MEEIIKYMILGSLLLTSVVGLAIIIERGVALRAGTIIPPSVEDALEACRTEADWPALQRICEQNPSPLSRLLLQAGLRRNWPKAENAGALETTARHEVSRMERRLVILEIVVGIAPLMGLVGTIYGLIELFGGLEEAGLGDNSGVARGIALALRATMMGLVTAIPSLIAWSYYSKKVENLAVEMAALCDQFLTRQYHRDEEGEPEEAPARRRP
ncbi:MAG: MotA/TolQ/ExbB proton channel family protein [Verrucomicrobiota bacterium]|jgi:biopolymer transport protein ExbB